MKAIKVLIGVVLAALVCCAITLADDFVPPRAAEAECVTDVCPTLVEPYVSPTTGKMSYVDPGPYRPLAIIIHNSLESRPQWGIQAADIVYEAHKDMWAYTRFLCIFNDTVPEIAGPVRSVRQYFLRMHQEWGCTLVHFGGPTKYWGEQVDAYGVNSEHVVSRYDLNNWRYRAYYWREYDKNIASHTWAPNNAFVNPAYIQQSANFVAEPRDPLKFSYSCAYGDEYKTVTGVQIGFYGLSNGYSYTSYTYDAEKDKLMRFNGPLNGNKEVHLEGSTRQQVEVQNLIVMNVNYSRPDDWHVLIELTGTGRCDYFIGGKHIVGTWSRPTYEDDTMYLDDKGEQIVLISGNTWIALKPSARSLVVEYAD